MTGKLTYRDAFFSQRRFICDKWEHYFEIYDHVIGPFYGSRINYLEIGVQFGGGLEIASKLFSAESAIVGLDIEPLCKNLEKVGLAKIFIGSQTDPKILGGIIEYCQYFDVIIDDGSHQQKDMIETFLILFPYLSEGGCYLIEDTHTNYSPKHQDAFFGIGLYDYFKAISERLNIDFMDLGTKGDYFKMPRSERTSAMLAEDISRQIFSIEFFDSVIAIRKKKKLEPLRLVEPSVSVATNRVP